MALRGASLALGLVALLAGSGLRADEVTAVRLRVVAEPPLPFSEEELAAAVALRLPLTEGPRGLQVLVGGSGPGRVRLAAAGRERQAWIGERRGPAAARVVALLVVDLARAERLPTAALSLAGGDGTAASTGRWELGLTGGLDLGVADVGPVFSPGGHLRWALGPRLGVVGRLSYAGARAELRGTGEAVSLHALPARVGLTARAGRFVAEAGAAVRLLITNGLARRTLARTGAFVAMQVELARLEGVAAFAFGALDAYGSKLEVRVAGRPVLASGYVAPVVGLGLGLALGGAGGAP